MTRRISTSPGAKLAYEAIGAGIPLVAFHGAYSSRVEVREFLEPLISGRPLRRIYVDLPGHGESRPSSGLATPDDVLDLVDLLLAEEAPSGRVLLLGHSFGAHFARAVAARHPSRTAGLALICAVVPGMDPSDAEGGVVADDGASAELTDDERTAFEEYFVVRTAEAVERYRRAVRPASGDVDEETLSGVFEPGPHVVDPDTVVVDVPVLVMAGRRDRWVGWRQQERLGELYPNATVVTVADAGHALPHEKPALVAALIADWLDRVGS